MSTSTQVDPLTVQSFNAVLMNGTGRKAHAAPISIDLTGLVLETKDSVRHAARQLQDKAKAAFEASVRAVSSNTSFAVKGLPDPKLELSDIFALTLGRAVTSIAICVAKGDVVGNIACSGLQVKGTAATITLTDQQVQSTSIIAPKRGTSLGTLSEEAQSVLGDMVLNSISRHIHTTAPVASRKTACSP